MAKRASTRVILANTQSSPPSHQTTSDHSDAWRKRMHAKAKAEVEKAATRPIRKGSATLMHKGREYSASHVDAYCRMVLYAAKDLPWSPPDQVQEILESVFSNHELADNIFSNFSHFEVRQHEDFNSRTFYAVRNSGWQSDTAYGYAGWHKGATLRTRVLKAMREAVRSQMESIKGKSCESCRRSGSLHVHHDLVTFAELADQWLSEHEMSVRRVSIDCFDGVWYMDNQKQLASWLAFHRENAKLKTLCKGCHKNEHAAKDGGR